MILMSYARRVIEICGGVRALSRALNRPSSTVMSWARRGSIPDEAKVSILALSRREGFGLRPEDFLPPLDDGAGEDPARQSAA